MNSCSIVKEWRLCRHQNFRGYLLDWLTRKRRDYDKRISAENRKLFLRMCRPKFAFVWMRCVIIMAVRTGSREKGNRSRFLDIRLDFVCRLASLGGNLSIVGSRTFRATFSCTALHPIFRWHQIRSSMVVLEMESKQSDHTLSTYLWADNFEHLTLVPLDCQS